MSTGTADFVLLLREMREVLRGSLPSTTEIDIRPNGWVAPTQCGAFSPIRESLRETQ